MRQRKYPATKPKKNNRKTIICLPYDNDEIYAFWCARYENISFEKYLKIPISEFNRKINSIPESEPLYKRIKSRVINIGKIKNKEERDYWRQLKRTYQIPNIYLGNEELEDILKEGIRNIGFIGGKENGKRFN